MYSGAQLACGIGNNTIAFHTAEMNTLKRKCADDTANLQSQHETEMESQRSQNEDKINRLDNTLRECQKTIVTLEGTVVELNTRLTQKADAEK